MLNRIYKILIGLSFLFVSEVVLAATNATGKVQKIRIHDSVTFNTDNTIWFTVSGFSGVTGCVQISGLNRVDVSYSTHSQEILSALYAVKMSNKDITVSVDEQCKLRWLDID